LSCQVRIQKQSYHEIKLFKSHAFQFSLQHKSIPPPPGVKSQSSQPGEQAINTLIPSKRLLAHIISYLPLLLLFFLSSPFPSSSSSSSPTKAHTYTEELYHISCYSSTSFPLSNLPPFLLSSFPPFNLSTIYPSIHPFPTYLPTYIHVPLEKAKAR